MELSFSPTADCDCSATANSAAEMTSADWMLSAEYPPGIGTLLFELEDWVHPAASSNPAPRVVIEMRANILVLLR